MSLIRTRWAAVGAAVAVTLGVGGVGLVSATDPSDATAFVAITPCRLMDTRPAPATVGPRSSPLGAADTHTVTVHGDNGDCLGIPATASAVALNVTAVGATEVSFLTMWPTGSPFPLASSLNPAPGQPPTPNAVTTELNAAGQFNIFNQFGAVNVIADVTGYYVDHHHDDRYYTEDESDALIEAAFEQQPWSVSMPSSAAALGAQASFVDQSTVGGPGILLPDGNFPSFTHGFTVPPQHRATEDVDIHITWMANEDNNPGCVFLLGADNVFAHRGARVWTSVAATFDEPRSPTIQDETLLVATDEGVQDEYLDNIVRDSVLTLDGTDIAAGDHISFELVRPTLAPEDNCAGGLTVFGLNAASV